MGKRIGPFTPNYAIAPGETLREWREANGFPSTRVAATACYAMPVEFYERIEAGEQPIDEEIAHKLAYGTAIPSWLWLRLEHHYRADLARLAARSEIAVAVAAEYNRLTPSPSPVTEWSDEDQRKAEAREEHR